MIDYKAVGNRIKNLRKEKNMTQEAFAEKLNVSIEHISRVENGINRPGMALLEKICKIFDIDENVLLFGENALPSDLALFEKISMLSEEKRRAISMIIDLIK